MNIFSSWNTKHLLPEKYQFYVYKFGKRVTFRLFYDVGSFSVSVNNQLAAFSEDIVGRRIYTILLKNLETGEFLTDKIENTTGKTVWAADNQHFFYIIEIFSRSLFVYV